MSVGKRLSLSGAFAKYRDFGLWLASAGMICCSAPLKGDVIGNPAKLEAVIQAYQANQRALKTWHGTAEIRTQANSPGIGERDTTAEVDFSYDQSGDSPAFSFFWRYLSSVRDFEGEHRKNEYAGVRMGGFMRDGTLTSYGPFKPGGKMLFKALKRHLMSRYF